MALSDLAARWQRRPSPLHPARPGRAGNERTYLKYIEPGRPKVNFASSGSLVTNVDAGSTVLPAGVPGAPASVADRKDTANGHKHAI